MRLFSRPRELEIGALPRHPNCNPPDADHESSQVKEAWDCHLKPRGPFHDERVISHSTETE